MQYIAHVCAYTVQYAIPSISDLADAHLALQPAPGAKTAGWLLGHLAVTGDYVRRKCGREPLTQKDWNPRFAPRSQPSRSEADYPRMAALRTAFLGVYRDLAAIAPALPAELLASPNALELTRHRFPTTGQFFTHIMTAHLAYHLGQLSGWRSAVGMPLRPGAESDV